MEVTRRRRRVRGTTESIGLIVLIGMGLVLLNAVSARLFARLDLTAGRMYTLSAASRQILDRLDDIISIRVYFSTNVPPQVLVLRQQVADLLSEYVAHAHGKVRVEWVDPLGDPEQEQKAAALGIPMLQMQAIQGDEARIVNGFMGLAVLFEDRKEVLPVVQSTANLEYDLTSAILKVASKEPKTVGVVSPASQEQSQGLSVLRRGLEQEFRVIDVTLSGDSATVPAQVNTLVVVGSPDLSDGGRWELDQFVMRGGRALFLADGVEVPPGTMQAFPKAPPYAGLLQHYGVTVNNDLVLDPSSALAPFDARGYRVVIQYPFWVKVIRGGFDKENPVVSELESVVLPWTSSLLAQPAEGVKATNLLTSTDKSWAQEGFFNLSPNQPWKELTGMQRKLALAVALQGKFKSYYAGQEPPAGVTPGQGGQPPRLDACAADTEILVVGSSRWATDFFMQQFASNQIFLLNQVDWLTLAPELIAVRSRGGLERPLRPLDQGMKTLLRFFNVGLMPFAVALFGLVWYLLRRRSRRLVEAFGG